MTDVIDLRVVKKTQDSLGSVIKKPPLHDKLLKKPPFRFLHDIITNVIRTTGFMKGLYTPEEMISTNIKDRESKVAFLQKAIDTVIFTTGQPLTVKPSKIVAGHEPEKTNELLQAIARAVINKMDSTQAVQRVLKGEKPSKSTLKKSKKDSSASKRNTEEVPSPVKQANKPQADSNEPSQAENNEKSNDLPSHVPNVDNSEKTEEKPQPPEAAEKPKEEEEPKKEENKEEPVERKRTSSTHRRSKSRASSRISREDRSPRAGSRTKAQSQSDVDLGSMNMDASGANESQSQPSDEGSQSSKEPAAVKNDSSVSIPPIPVPIPPPTKIADTEATPAATNSTPAAETPVIPAKTSDDPEPFALNLSSEADGEANGNYSARPKSGRAMLRSARTARPTSARPAPPKIKKRVVMETEEQVRLMSAKPVSNLIMDSGAHTDEEEESFVVEEAPPPTPEDNQVTQQAPEPLEDEQKGSLVKQLLETKKDLEGGSQQNNQRKIEIDKSLISDASRQKERESASRELGRLKLGIQTLSRYANPLGKMLDFLQEDIDSMQQEWHKWQKEYQENLQALKREQSATDAILEPLHNQLEELDQAIMDQLEQISAIKAKIFNNDERINKLLAGLARY